MTLHAQPLVICFSPRHIDKIPPGARIIVVRLNREPEEFGDLCATLRERGISFRLVAVEGSGFQRGDAEILMALAIAATFGEESCEVFSDTIEKIAPAVPAAASESSTPAPYALVSA